MTAGSDTGNGFAVSLGPVPISYPRRSQGDGEREAVATVVEADCPFRRTLPVRLPYGAMTFYERTLSCGLCPASTTIAAGEWNQQVPAIGAWSEQHRQKAHAEHEGEVPTSLDPSPMYDR